MGSAQSCSDGHSKEHNNAHIPSGNSSVSNPLNPTNSLISSNSSTNTSSLSVQSVSDTLELENSPSSEATDISSNNQLYPSSDPAEHELDNESNDGEINASNPTESEHDNKTNDDESNARNRFPEFTDWKEAVTYSHDTYNLSDDIDESFVETISPDHKLKGRGIICDELYRILYHQLSNSKDKWSSHLVAAITKLRPGNSGMSHQVSFAKPYSLKQVKFAGGDLDQTLKKLCDTTEQNKQMLVGELESIIDNTFPRFDFKELKLNKNDFNVSEFVKSLQEEWENMNLSHNKTGSQNIVTITNLEKYLFAMSYENEKTLEAFVRREQFCNLEERLMTKFNVIHQLFQQSVYSKCDGKVISLYSLCQSISSYIFDLDSDLFALDFQILQLQQKLLPEFVSNIWTLDNIDDEIEPTPNKKARLLCPLCQQQIGNRKICKCDGCSVQIHVRCWNKEKKNFAIWSSFIICGKCQDESNSAFGIILPL